MVPGGELKEVATGMVIQPKSKDVMHTTKMDKGVVRFRLAKVVPEFHDIAPPFNLWEPTKTWSLEIASHGLCHGRSPRFVLGGGS